MTPSTPNPNAEALRPCAHCGSPYVGVERGAAFCMAPNCTMQTGKWLVDADAVAAWNRRADSAEMAQLRERVKSLTVQGEAMAAEMKEHGLWPKGKGPIYDDDPYLGLLVGDGPVFQMHKPEPEPSAAAEPVTGGLPLWIRTALKKALDGMLGSNVDNARLNAAERAMSCALEWDAKQHPGLRYVDEEAPDEAGIVRVAEESAGLWDRFRYEERTVSGNVRGGLQAIALHPIAKGEVIELRGDGLYAMRARAEAKRRAPADFCDECRAKFEAAGDGDIIALCSRCGRAAGTFHTVRKYGEPSGEPVRLTYDPEPGGTRSEPLGTVRRMLPLAGKSSDGPTKISQGTVRDIESYVYSQFDPERMTVTQSAEHAALAERVKALEDEHGEHRDRLRLLELFRADMERLLGFGRMAGIDARAGKQEERIAALEGWREAFKAVLEKDKDQ